MRRGRACLVPERGSPPLLLLPDLVLYRSRLVYLLHLVRPIVFFPALLTLALRQTAPCPAALHFPTLYHATLVCAQWSISPSGALGEGVWYRPS